MDEAIDLTGCESEPITIPGSIQPHGLLLALRGTALTVVQASANLPLFLGIAPREMLGQPVGQWFDEAAAHALAVASLWEDPGQANPLPVTGRGSPDQRFDGILHRSGADLILELERVNPGAVVPSVRGALAELQNASTEAEVCWIAAQQAHRLTGFDRVMVYRFAPDWSGEVVAEIRGHGVDSYLGTHFPASDIPKQARELYTRKLLGLIPDVTYSPVPLLALEEGPPLDMTHCVLRSVSPIHLQFLRNMGVAATLTVSLVIGGKLWGMIACHHGKPWFGPFALRQDCQFLGQVTAAQIRAHAAATAQIYRFKRTEMLAKLLEQIAGVGDFGAGLTKGQPNLMDFVESTGAAVLFDDVCLSAGRVPSESALINLRDWLIAHSGEPLFATHTLPLLYPPARVWKSVASGLLAARILPENGCYALWFRPEVMRTVTWAGDPKKPVSVEGEAARLSPRKSFEAWKQAVELQSLPWTEVEIDSVTELRNTLSGAVTGQIERARISEVQRQANEQKVAREAAEEAARALHKSEKRLQESEERFRKANEQLHVLSRRLFQVQEEERRHLAREIHDQMGQTLTAAKIDLQTAQSLEERSAIVQRLDNSIAILERLLEQARHLSLELRPPLLDDLGLVPALRWYLDQHAQRAGLRVEFFADPALERFDAEIETACFRVAQEALSNVMRHARAQTVRVELHRASEALHLVARDDGIGFDVATAQQGATLGLLGIRERVALVGGELDYKSMPGRGTEVHVFFPVRPRPAAAEPRL